MINSIIVIVIALVLFLLLWKLLKNFVKAIIIVVILLLLFSGVIFVRDYTIIKSVTSSDRLVVLENSTDQIIGFKGDEIIYEDFKTPHIAIDIDKFNFEFTGNSLVQMLQSNESSEVAIKTINQALSENLMTYLDQSTIKIRPEPYFMAILKGTFRERIRSDVGLVGDAIKTNVRDLTARNSTE